MPSALRQPMLDYRILRSDSVHTVSIHQEDRKPRVWGDAVYPFPIASGRTLQEEGARAHLAGSWRQIYMPLIKLRVSYSRRPLPVRRPGAISTLARQAECLILKSDIHYWIIGLNRRVEFPYGGLATHNLLSITWMWGNSYPLPRRCPCQSIVGSDGGKQIMINEVVLFFLGVLRNWVEESGARVHLFANAVWLLQVSIMHWHVTCVITHPDDGGGLVGKVLS